MKTGKETEKCDPSPRKEILNRGRVINAPDVRNKDEWYKITCEELYVKNLEAKLDIITVGTFQQRNQSL